MTIKKIFDYPIISTAKVNVSASDLISALLVIAIAYTLSKIIKRYFRTRVQDKRLEKPTAYAVEKLTRYVLWIFAIIIALDCAGIEMSLLLAGSAALLVGIGLGLQQIFKDLVSGIFILFERNIRIGDLIEFNNLKGIVRSIGIRTSEIVLTNNHRLIVPNSLIIGDAMTNWSGENQLNIRGSVSVGVSYNSDVKLVEKLLLDCAKNHKDIDQNQTPFVRLNNFGDSSIQFELFFWILDTNLVENVKSDVRFSIFDTFAKNNIIIPFPQLDIHNKN